MCVCVCLRIDTGGSVPATMDSDDPRNLFFGKFTKGESVECSDHFSRRCEIISFVCLGSFFLSFCG